MASFQPYFISGKLWQIRAPFRLSSYVLLLFFLNHDILRDDFLKQNAIFAPNYPLNGGLRLAYGRACSHANWGSVIGYK